MAENRRLSVNISVQLQTLYRNVETLLNPDALLDNLNVDFSQDLANGSGLNKADLQWYDRRQLINALEFIDVDGVETNQWGDILDFDAVKCFIIHNRETELTDPNFGDNDKNLLIIFKSDRYNIGPNGTVVRIEPAQPGIPPLAASGSEEEGRITISSASDVTYDIIIIGSQDESSSGP